MNASRRALAAASGLSIERATIALNAAHTSPKAAGKVFNLVRPRLAGLWHTLLSPQVISMLNSELREVYADAQDRHPAADAAGPRVLLAQQPR